MLLLGFSRFGSKLVKTSIPNNNSGKHAAFTLAEVLITLGIIGVVAAMTMPTIINKVNHVVLKNQFKKMYSVLTTAIQKTNFEMDFNTDCYYTHNPGETASYVLSGCPAFFKEYLPKNLKVIKTCDGNGFDDGCLPDYNWAPFNSGCAGFYSDNIKSNAFAAILNDGSLFFTFSLNSGSIFPLIAFDVNGKKGPNKVGEDVYAMALHRKGSNINIGQVSDKGLNVTNCLSKKMYYDGENFSE